MPVEGAEVTGPDAGAFRFVGSECQSEEGPCTFAVAFDPKSGPAGPRNATLNLVDPDAALVATVSLTGTATVRPVPPPPPVTGPKLTLKLKSPGKVKRGKTLVVRAIVKNVGDGPARPLTVKARVPKRLAKAPRAIKVRNLAPGKSVTRKLKVKVKRNARKGKRLKVKVVASSGKVKRTATRTVRVR